MAKPVAVILYAGCTFFEVALAAEVIAAKRRVEYFTPEGAAHHASNGAVIEAAGDFAALAAADLAAVLVPGGDPRSILLPAALASFALRAQFDRGALIAGICAGNLVIAAAGLLAGRRVTHNYALRWATAEQVRTAAPYWHGITYVEADLVQDGRVITAMPWAYRRFAARVARELSVLDEAEASALETYLQRRTLDNA